MKRTLSIPFLLTAVLAVSLSCGCHGEIEEPSAEVLIPAYPFWPNPAFVVDEGRIASLASALCEAEGAGPSRAAFFLGDLPMGSLDLLCLSALGDPDAPPAEVLLGDLYISGYFGGVWLRDSIDGGHGHGHEGEAPAGFERSIFDALVAAASGLLELGRHGSDASVLSGARFSVPLFLLLYGYNFGYIEVALENPPEGTPPVEGLLACKGFLDCESPSIELDTLDRFESAHDRLLHPPSLKWAWMAELVEIWGEGSVASGRAVWEEILEGGAFAGSAYELLLELSAAYLLVSESAVLAGMTAWADADPPAGRCGALLQAGLLVWSGSYFLGLTSSVPEGTFPEIRCPD